MKHEKGSLIFLGTGGSMGVPVVGCYCKVCASTSPYNKRLRPSALIQCQSKNILIDAGPDFRIQALRERIDHLDGVIFTHAHHDHTAGIDDLRVFHRQNNRAIPCLVSQETADDLMVRYSYIFKKKNSPDCLVSKVDLHLMNGERGEISFVDFCIKYLTYMQAGMSVSGLRCGNLAFISDIKHYPDTIFEDLEGIDVLVLSALRFDKSPLHFSIDEAVEFSRQVNPKKTWLTHLAHEVSHEEANSYLPSNIRLAYDGLRISFTAELCHH